MQLLPSSGMFLPLNTQGWCTRADPLLPRTLTAAVVVTSCAVYANNSLFQYVYFDWAEAFAQFPPKLWTPITAFLVSGPKLYIIMDPYFSWSHLCLALAQA